MFNEIRYDICHEDVDYMLPTVFLAGPTVRGNQPHLRSWRFEAIAMFKNRGFTGNLIIPEFKSKTESDQHRFDLPLWEFIGLSKSKVVMVWLPRTKELIGLTTNFELGYWMGADIEKVVYGHPPSAYRTNYTDIMWTETHLLRNGRGAHVPPVYTRLESIVEASIKKAMEV